MNHIPCILLPGYDGRPFLFLLVVLPLPKGEKVAQRQGCRM